MPRGRDLLNRFRPAAAPGPARAAGIPADRRLLLEAELAPIFDHLAATERACASLLEDARADAANRLARAEEEARLVVARAEAAVAQERASAFERALTRHEIETAALRADAETEARSVGHRASAQVAEYVDRIVAAVDAMVTQFDRNGS